MIFALQDFVQKFQITLEQQQQEQQQQNNNQNFTTIYCNSYFFFVDIQCCYVDMTQVPKDWSN